MYDPSTAAERGDPAMRPAGSGTDATERVRVWDPFVRIFHWSLASAALIAFVTEDKLLDLHTWAGYAVIGLIAARLLWGLIGPRHARWSDFVRGPRTTLAYLGDILRGHPARYLGHNPAGAVMVVALIAGLIATTVTGLMVLGAGELSGPLAPSLSEISAEAAHDLKKVHETIAYTTLLLVPLHLIGMAFASLQHKENLVRAMIDGYKQQ